MTTSPRANETPLPEELQALARDLARTMGMDLDGAERAIRHVREAFAPRRDPQAMSDALRRAAAADN